MNDDTHAVYEGLANDEFLYRECERAARYAAAVTDNQENFEYELSAEIARIADANRDMISGYSNSEDIDYSLVDYDEIASEYEYADYK
ncbi:MAG TPA: hypothetical protein VFE08_14475 [Candidatus Sulfotelmatobacter sp.]|nr:hypothetical protein [Candidatus Sulfotelmatobacter sp.]